MEASYDWLVEKMTGVTSNNHEAYNEKPKQLVIFLCETRLKTYLRNFCHLFLNFAIFAK